MTWVAASGARLGERYVLEAKVGEGGMGEVWRAKHLALENEVAIKLLSGSLAGNDETKKRFLMEAKLTAQLRSRNAVQVFDFGLTDDGQPYLVMELLHGEPLGDRIDREKHLSNAAVAHLMMAAAKALHRAHASGIVHRDFKPDNVFLTKGEEGEEVKVVDFGIAKLIGSLDEARPSATDLAELTGKALSTLTRTGKLVGTPHYMSPEQVRMSDEVGPPTDIWAFGVVAYEALTGKCPFEGESVVTLFANIQLGKHKNASDLNPDVPPAFDVWFKKCCAVEPSMRFADAMTAANELAEALGISVSRAPMAAESSGRIVMTSSPDIAIISGADAAPRTSSKNTMMSTSADALPIKKSRAALWIMLAGVGIGVGALVFAFASSRTAPQAPPPNAAPIAHTDAPPVSAAPVVSATTQVATGDTATTATSAEPAASTAPQPATATNTGKVHGSGGHKSHGSAPSSDATAAQHSASPPPAGTTSSPSSPFSLPPLGL